MKLESLSPSLQQRWRAADRNGDNLLQDHEVLDYLAEQGELRAGADQKRLIQEFRASFQPQRAPSGYTTYEQAAQRLHALAQKFPHLAQCVSLGKTPEGRDIWALRIGRKGEGEAPGAVITGCHHAREWMTVEVPLDLATTMLEGYAKDASLKKRIDQSEVWIVPIVNPDGYEYSRTNDSWWRKNRRPVEETGCPKPKPPSNWENSPWAQTPIGVDLNRNYFTPRFPEMYRAPGDQPCSFGDDPSHTSDAPRSDTYRGPKGASEPEVQAMMSLGLRDNIRGVVDYHSYGNMILYPWGYTSQPPENVEFYKTLGQRMNAAAGGLFKVQPSMDLYPTTGTSSDVFHAHGKIALTLEIGTSFQPPPLEIPATVARLTRANLVFLDEVLGT